MIKKSNLDVLFSLDISNNYILKVVLYVDEFEIEGNYNSSKDIPTNINLFPQVQALLRDLHNAYVKRKVKENKFNEVEKIDASNFFSQKFNIQAQNLFSLRVEGNNFLLRKKISIKNYHNYTNDEKPLSQDIVKSIENLDSKKIVLKHPNFKDLKTKEFKPTKVDLSKIPSSSLDNEEIDEEYKPFLLQTSLSNPNSTLTKDIYLKHKRRKSSIAKPTKSPTAILNLFNEYQNVLANVKLTSLSKYMNMQKYKETISNVHSN